MIGEFFVDVIGAGWGYSLQCAKEIVCMMAFFAVLVAPLAVYEWIKQIVQRARA